MSSTVERIGRAIAGADDEDYMEDWKRYDKRARAAIKALSNPPGDVYMAFRDRLCELMGNDFSTQYIVDESLAAFFDAALKEKPE